VETNEQRILVIGAGGLIGKPVALYLRSLGHPVRVSGRNAAKLQNVFGDDFEIVQADATVPESLAAAMEGCYGVHISLAGGYSPSTYEKINHFAVANIARAAEEAGIQQITHITGSTVEEEVETPFIVSKLRGENALLEGSVPATIFRASWFMETVAMMVQKGNIMIPGRQSNLFRFIAADDFARMVATAFAKPTGSGIYYAYGPQTMQLKEAARIYLDAFYPQGTVKTISLKGFTFISKFLPRGARVYADLMNHFEVHSEPVHPGPADEIFGRNQTTLKKWIELKKGPEEE